jgi:dipeptidyl aminopeptidase/acylaminoacyl peptidase
VPEVFAHVSERLWLVSIAGGAPAVVKKDLPSPVGILVPAFSPTATHLAYEPLKADKAAGLYIMSTGDGKETLVVPRSEAMTFGAEWSPDGKYVAYYYGKRLTGQEYDILPAEDGPRTVTETIEIASVSGQRVAKFSVQGLKLSEFSWSQDSKSIVFAAVNPKKATDQSEPATLEWKSLYAGDIIGKTQKIADLPALTGYSGMTFPAPGGAAYCLVYWNGGSALYYLAASQPAKLVEPAGAQPKFFWTGRPGSDLGKALVLTIDLADAKRSVVEVFESKATVLASGSDSLMLGPTSGSRFAYIIDDSQKKSLILRVMEVK